MIVVGLGGGGPMHYCQIIVVKGRIISKIEISVCLTSHHPEPILDLGPQVFQMRAVIDFSKCFAFYRW